MVLIGKYKITQLTEVVRNYVNDYVICKICKSTNTELERNKVKCLMIDCPKEFNKFIGNFDQEQMNFLLNEGLLSSATVWEKFIEWSGRKKHTTGHGADFIDGTDAKFSSPSFTLIKCLC